MKTITTLLEQIRKSISTAKEGLTDEEVRKKTEEVVLSAPETIHWGFREKSWAVERIFSSLRRELGILQLFADDDEVSEIMVNGAESIFIERQGKVQKLQDGFSSTEELEELIRRMAAKVHREINELSPIVDARLSDGSRINAIYKNIALNGPILTIRRFPKKRITMTELIRTNTITEEAAFFLKMLVEAAYNIFISGGTSSGKTTFLNVLSDYIPKEERVIVIEDSAELQITGIENLVRLETRSANVQGKGEITVRELIRTSLRMRPDRIIVGEVRGEEVVDMLQAMNTGHDGSLSTGHGNSPRGMLRRMEAMFLSAAAFPADAIRAQIGEAIDIIVHMGRLSDKSRTVLQICEITGYEGGNFELNTLYQYEAGKGLKATGNRLTKREKLQIHGMDAEWELK